MSYFRHNIQDHKGAMAHTEQHADFGISSMFFQPSSIREMIPNGFVLGKEPSADLEVPISCKTGNYPKHPGTDGLSYKDKFLNGPISSQPGSNVDNNHCSDTFEGLISSEILSPNASTGKVINVGESHLLNCDGHVTSLSSYQVFDEGNAASIVSGAQLNEGNFNEYINLTASVGQHFENISDQPSYLYTSAYNNGLATPCYSTDIRGSPAATCPSSLHVSNGHRNGERDFLINSRSNGAYPVLCVDKSISKNLIGQHATAEFYNKQEEEEDERMWYPQERQLCLGERTSPVRLGTLSNEFYPQQGQFLQQATTPMSSLIQDDPFPHCYNLECRRAPNSRSSDLVNERKESENHQYTKSQLQIQNKMFTQYNMDASQSKLLNLFSECQGKNEAHHFATGSISEGRILTVENSCFASEAQKPVKSGAQTSLSLSSCSSSSSSIAYPASVPCLPSIQELAVPGTQQSDSSGTGENLGSLQTIVPNSTEGSLMNVNPCLPIPEYNYITSSFNQVKNDALHNKKVLGNFKTSECCGPLRCHLEKESRAYYNIGATTDSCLTSMPAASPGDNKNMSVLGIVLQRLYELYKNNKIPTKTPPKTHKKGDAIPYAIAQLSICELLQLIKNITLFQSNGGKKRGKHSASKDGQKFSLNPLAENKENQVEKYNEIKNSTSGADSIFFSSDVGKIMEKLGNLSGIKNHNFLRSVARWCKDQITPRVPDSKKEQNKLDSFIAKENYLDELMRYASDNSDMSDKSFPRGISLKQLSSLTGLLSAPENAINLYLSCEEFDQNYPETKSCFKESPEKKKDQKIEKTCEGPSSLKNENEIPVQVFQRFDLDQEVGSVTNGNFSKEGEPHLSDNNENEEIETSNKDFNIRGKRDHLEKLVTNALTLMLSKVQSLEAALLTLSELQTNTLAVLIETHVFLDKKLSCVSNQAERNMVNSNEEEYENLLGNATSIIKSLIHRNIAGSNFISRSKQLSKLRARAKPKDERTKQACKTKNYMLPINRRDITISSGEHFSHTRNQVLSTNSNGFLSSIYSQKAPISTEQDSIHTSHEEVNTSGRNKEPNVCENYLLPSNKKNEPTFEVRDNEAISGINVASLNEGSSTTLRVTNENFLCKGIFPNLSEIDYSNFTENRYPDLREESLLSSAKGNSQNFAEEKELEANLRNSLFENNENQEKREMQNISSECDSNKEKLNNDTENCEPSKELRKEASNAQPMDSATSEWIQPSLLYPTVPKNPESMQDYGSKPPRGVPLVETAESLKNSKQQNESEFPEENYKANNVPEISRSIRENGMLSALPHCVGHLQREENECHTSSGPHECGNMFGERSSDSQREGKKHISAPRQISKEKSKEMQATTSSQQVYERCLLRLSALAIAIPRWALYRNSYKWHCDRLGYSSCRGYSQPEQLVQVKEASEINCSQQQSSHNHEANINLEHFQFNGCNQASFGSEAIPKATQHIGEATIETNLFRNMPLNSKGKENRFFPQAREYTELEKYNALLQADRVIGSSQKEMSCLSQKAIDFLRAFDSQGKLKEYWKQAVANMNMMSDENSVTDVNLNFKQSVELIPLWITRLNNLRQKNERDFVPLVSLPAYMQSFAVFEFLSFYVSTSSKEISEVLENLMKVFLVSEEESAIESFQGTSQRKLHTPTPVKRFIDEALNNENCKASQVKNSKTSNKDRSDKEGSSERFKTLPNVSPVTWTGKKMMMMVCTAKPAFRSIANEQLKNCIITHPQDQKKKQQNVKIFYEQNQDKTNDQQVNPRQFSQHDSKDVAAFKDIQENGQLERESSQSNFLCVSNLYNGVVEGCQESALSSGHDTQEEQKFSKSSNWTDEKQVTSSSLQDEKQYCEGNLNLVVNKETNLSIKNMNNSLQSIVWEVDESWSSFPNNDCDSSNHNYLKEAPSSASTIIEKVTLQSCKQVKNNKSDPVNFLKVSQSALPKTLVPGVYWYRNRNGWVAQWFENGKNKHKFFAASSYGIDGAKQKAIAYRLMKLEEKNRKKRNKNMIRP